MKKKFLLILIYVFVIIFTNTVNSAICGDGACNRGPENCNNCPEDCGCDSGYNCWEINCVDYRLSHGIKIDSGCGDNKCDGFWRETCYKDNCCGGKAVDFNNDNKNCGICWNACEEDYVCEQGICIFNIKDDLSYYPQFFIKGNKLDVVIVVGDKAPSSHVLAQTQIALSLSDYIFRRTGIQSKELTKLASDIDDIDNFNMISLGNACINEVSAKILENPKPCNNLQPGKATIEIYKSKRNKAHIVLNAYSDEGIKKATEVISRYYSYDFKGNKFILEVEEKEIFEDKIVKEDKKEEPVEAKETEIGEEKQKIIEELTKKINEPKEEKSKDMEKKQEIKIKDKDSQQKVKDNTIKIIINWFKSLFSFLKA